ncbi:DNA circularization N-terminal domain-containing protein [Vibrio sp. 10N.286.46.A8]|uniref:DNA circularization N-terminal domain-containing protein n=1 Tax=Vibrio sp. 10N.286.46.A8 TaxID=3229697 RepID=UPI003558641E
MWSGHNLNILSTFFDGGKRLPHIKVIGTKARTYTIEAVFVGSTYLVDVNALINNFDVEPKPDREFTILGFG